MSVYLFCRGAGAGAAGVPVVAGESSGVQVIALRSYLNPFAALSASFVEFMTRYHLLLFLLVDSIERDGDVLLAHPEEASGAHDQCGYLAFAVD
jgi:cytochrome bd-type quinol oxidase subunit 2